MQFPTSCHTLSNGLNILLHPDQSSSKVVLQLLFHSGSKDESFDQQGFAHLCEHLYFTGTPKVPNFDREISEHGCENNAWTDLDQTCFTSTGPPLSLDLMLWVEQDRWKNLRLNLSTEVFETERSVVLNELKEEYENEPYGEMWLQRPSFIFGEDHPYSHPVIGNSQTLKKATEVSVQRFMLENYVPNNAVLMLSGQFSPKEVLPRIAKYFGDIPSRALKDLPLSKVNFQEARLNISDQAHNEVLHLEWLLPPYGDPILKVYSLLAEILTSPRYGILFQRLELEGKLVSTIEAYTNIHSEASHFSISCAPIHISNTQLKEIILEELNIICTQGIEPMLLNQVRNKLELLWWIQNANIDSRSEEMLSWFAHRNTMDGFENQKEEWISIQEEEIVSALKRLLSSPLKEIHCTPIGHS